MQAQVTSYAAAPHQPQVIPVAPPMWSLRRAVRGGFLAGVVLTLLAVFFTRWVLLFALAALTVSATMALVRAIMRAGAWRAERRQWRRRQRAIAQQQAWAAYQQNPTAAYAQPTAWHPGAQQPQFAQRPHWEAPERAAWPTRQVAAPPQAEPDDNYAQRALDDFDRRLAEALSEDAEALVLEPATARAGT